MLELPVPQLSRAILIGASRFSGLENLPAVRNNLRDLFSALADKETGILPRDRVTVVSDPRSTAAFMTSLRAAALQAEDFFLVYYAGHGVRDQVHDERLYLAVQETDKDGPDGTAVPFESVRDVIKDSRAKSRVLILDCCYSGMAVGAMSGSVVDAREVAVEGTAVITSSPRNSISLSPPGDRNTAFSGELASLLRAGSPVPGQPLTVDTAFRSLRRVLAQRHLPEPKMKVTDTSSDILLRRPPPPPPPPPKPPRQLVRPPIIERPAPRVVVRNPASEPRTIPSLRPASPEPQNAPRPSSPWARISKLLAAHIGWFAIWVAFSVSLSLAVGGTVGLISGSGDTKAADTDLGACIGGWCGAVVTGLILGLHIRRLRSDHGRPKLGDLSPIFTGPLRVAGTVVLVVLFLLCLGMIPADILIPSVSTATTSGFSPVDYTVFSALVWSTSAAGCAYWLCRRWWPGAPPVTDGAPVEQT